MNVVLTEKIPIRLWVTNIEEGALSQARDLANLPFAFKHVSVMPDAHQGYGMPIGGVLATKSVVIPNAVGVDIGCGMCAVKTSLSSIDIGVLKSIMSQIRNTVPVGFNHQKEPVNWNGFTTAPDIQVVKEQLSSAAYQLGTLGGGNHFIEIQKGSDGFIWVMIHSGSRNLGYKIANDFHKKAVSMCERWYSDLPNKDLSFLPLDSTLGEQYLSAMNFALRFAKENRDQMIMAVKNAFDDNVSDISYDDTVNIHHNFASMENHFSKNVMVHRKGATSAKLNQLGIIPGSQGTKSYIVEGLGNKDSFESCSHGAGRRMGRKQAQRELNLEEEQTKLNNLGVLHSIRTEKDLDEAAGAYKDIETVMNNQKDLVKVLVELSPLGVIKG